jgi:hypothetical protein
MEVFMKLSKQTIEVLKNFSSINQGILFREGNVIRTMSVMKNIFGAAIVPDDFPREFAVYDLSEFLSTVSLFIDPDLQFKDEYFVISENGTSVKYFYSNPSVVVSPPNKSIAMPSSDVTFTISKSQLEQIQKAAAVMKLKDLAVTERGLKVFNRNNVGNQYTVEIPIDSEDDTFEYILKVENLKLIPSDYQVTVTKKGIAQFKSNATKETPELEYFIALESE